MPITFIFCSSKPRLVLTFNIKFLFLTAHTLNRRNPVLSNYFEKFEESTGKSIEDFYLNKNVDRFNKLYELLYGVDS